MIIKRFAALHLAALAAATLICAAGAAAQDARATGSRTTGSAVHGIPPTVPPAPVGHRQPKLSDLPAESQNAATTTERSARDRELDGKLQICRGC
ncbi:MAG TPA: hypothetical protein VIU42_12475 [Xanthobacteraceae bacterium]